MRASQFVSGLLLTCACGPGSPQEGGTDGSSPSSTASGPSTSDMPTTTAEPPPTTTEDDGTCPNGQPTLAPLWSRTTAQEPDGERWVVGPPLVIDTGAALWELQMPGLNANAPRSLAVGPGGEIVAASGRWPNNEAPEMRVTRVGADAEIVWSRDLFEPGADSGELNDLAVTGDGQVIVLRRWLTPEEKITATSLALADGATLWDTDAVVATPAGPPEMLRPSRAVVRSS